MPNATSPGAFDSDQLGSTQHRALDRFRRGLARVFRKRYSVGLQGCLSGNLHDLRPMYHFRRREPARQAVLRLQAVEDHWSSGEELTRWVLLKDGRLDRGRSFWWRLFRG